MVNEKYASVNKLNIGDTIKVTVKGASASVKISGIYEQYINNYIYMTSELYQKLYSKPPVYNMLCASLEEAAGERAEKFSSAMLSDSRVVAVTFMAEKITEFKNMLNSLNMVVIVMIVCAAALAFVVLYNLTNINIAERIREIATFKVLGFYNRETSSFIYKENIILTLLGIAAGLGLGVLLTGFIVKTVEVDNIMFGREIYFTSYLYAAGLTMLFSLAVNAVMSFKIKAVNMVESLKSVE
jgi:putative ABC transport system permease protein